MRSKRIEHHFDRDSSTVEPRNSSDFRHYLRRVAVNRKTAERGFAFSRRGGRGSRARLDLQGKEIALSGIRWPNLWNSPSNN